EPGLADPHTAAPRAFQHPPPAIGCADRSALALAHKICDSSRPLRPGFCRLQGSVIKPQNPFFNLGFLTLSCENSDIE
ncbi:MAG TPA: hypothetical protein PKC70_12025, partial [Cellvibrionaceae bacterium]|nr:hypothetical protein [Cellvibrionaceae bacterium]